MPAIADSMKLLALRKWVDDNQGLVECSKRLGVHNVKLANWIARGQVPPQEAPRVERVTGISRVMLRPFDWHLIWPELVPRKGRPTVESATTTEDD